MNLRTVYYYVRLIIVVTFCKGRHVSQHMANKNRIIRIIIYVSLNRSNYQLISTSGLQILSKIRLTGQKVIHILAQMVANFGVGHLKVSGWEDGWVH